MSKRDLFVIIYCCTYGTVSIILLMFLCYIFKIIDSSTFIMIDNLVFLVVTSSFVLIKPIGKLVDKYIINKLP